MGQIPRSTVRISSFAHVTLFLTRWLSYTNLTCIPWRRTRVPNIPNMKLLAQGCRKSEYYIYKQTDRCDQTCYHSRIRGWFKIKSRLHCFDWLWPCCTTNELRNKPTTNRHTCNGICALLRHIGCSPTKTTWTYIARKVGELSTHLRRCFSRRTWSWRRGRRGSVASRANWTLYRTWRTQARPSRRHSAARRCDTTSRSVPGCRPSTRTSTGCAPTRVGHVTTRWTTRSAHRGSLHSVVA